MKPDHDFPEVNIESDFIVLNNIGFEMMQIYREPMKVRIGCWLLCLAGELDTEINLIRHRIVKNDVVTIAPGTFCRFYGASEDVRFSLIGFSDRFLAGASMIRSDMNYSLLISEIPVLSLPAERAVLFRDFFDLLFRTFSTCGPMEKELHYYIYASMHTRMRALYQKQALDSRPLTAGERLYRKFVRLVRENFTAHHDPSFYAAELQVTRQHLNKLVRHFKGSTTYDAIAEAVIMDAMGRLKYSDWTIGQIADIYGFPDSSTFGKYFKRYRNITPNEYRKQ